jgi:succinate-acetate transporter protein
MKPLANSIPFGFFGIALALWSQGSWELGWLGTQGTLPAAMAWTATVLLFGGAIFAFFRGETFFLAAFGLLAALCLSTALGGPLGIGRTTPWYWVWWVLAALALWMGAFRLQGVLLQGTFLLVLVFLLGLFSMELGWASGKIFSGWVGVLGALLATYVAAAELLNECFGKVVLPLGAGMRRHEAAGSAAAS